MTHPFHPLFGQALVFVARMNCWRGDVVYWLDEQGRRWSIPAGWTDVVPDGPFAAAAAGRCPYRLEDLVALAGLVDGRRDGDDRVRGSAPQVSPDNAVPSCATGALGRLSVL